MTGSTNHDDRPVLYHAPPSFYSQIARLVLAEKGVEHERRFVLPGPPVYDAYAPWYMELNPAGTVPTLILDGESIPDSREILYAVDARCDGPSLTPDDEDARDEMERWIEAQYAIPERELTYGTGLSSWIGPHMNRARIANVERRARDNPRLADVYDAKLEDLRAFLRDSTDPERVAAARTEADERLDELDVLLADRRFVAGNRYSLADVVWTVSVARHRVLRLAPLVDRPHLAAWYARMKARPSFADAPVWERLRPFDLLGAIARRKPVVPVVLGMLAVIVTVAGLRLLIGAAHRESGAVAGQRSRRHVARRRTR